MIKNYLTTAYRALLRQKGTAFLNITGLMLGVTGSILLFLLLQYHTSFDKFQSKYDRIYRVATSSKANDGSLNYTSGIPSVLPPAFRLDFPEVEEVILTQYFGGALILIPQANGEFKKFDENEGVGYTESNYFRIFDRKAIAGDLEKSLDEPLEAVISQKLAIKYFGKEDVIGEVFKYGDREFKIGAVMEHTPSNTDMPFNILLSYETIRKGNEEKGWGSIWSDEQCYFLLKEGESISSVEARMEAFGKKHNNEDDFDETRFVVTPFSELHFDERFGNYNYNTVSKSNLIALGIIALFLILTASINFINLATAEAVKRSKEVGIRKSLGSSRNQLIWQFLGETGLVAFFAVLLSLGFAQLSLGYLNSFMELELKLDLLSNTGLIVYIAGVFVLVSVFSGLYPALVISGFKPVVALKNQINSKNSSGYRLRQGLVVTQFFISQLLVIVTIVIISQMNYFKTKELGFRKDAIISLPLPEQERPATDSIKTSKMRTLAHEISQLAGVEKYSLCFTPPSSGSVMGTGFLMEGESDDKRKDTQVKAADGNYVDLYDLKIIAGQNLDDYDTARSVLVNRKLAEIAGFSNPEDIIGKRIRVNRRFLPVAGVLENFHTTSLGSEIEATVLFNRIDRYQNLSLRITPEAFQRILPDIQKKWEATYPESIFSYEFLDESISNFYRSEERASIMLSVFASLAIAIGCLGLFGLATFMANQKTKEIGVRKVLGASVESILFLFSKEFIKLIAIGFCLAAPLAWYLTDQYLDQFAYKITVGPAVFLIGLGVTFLIAFVTVGYRSLKAATTNPAQSLKSE